MPWKEPGDKPREPWGSGDGTRERPDKTPGGGSGNGNRPGSSGNRPGGSGFDPGAQWKRLRQRLGRFGGGPAGAVALIVLIIVLYFVFGSWTLIDARQAGVVLRFGQFERVLGPGLHPRLPRPFTEVLKIDIGRSRTVSDQLRMLTRDEQIALVDFYVQYKVADARQFLFAVRDPEDAMRQATLAAVRAQIGTQTMQELLAKTDTGLTSRIRVNLQHTLDAYQSGITVDDVGIQNVSVPQEVKEAYDDVGNARQDAQRVEDDARAATAKAESDAHAQAAQWQAGADAYKTQITSTAQGDVARFDLILSAYRAAPDVTRRRLWLQTMQDVLGASRSVIDNGSGRTVIQLPPQPVVSAEADDGSAPAPAASSGVSGKNPTSTAASKSGGGAP